MKLYGALASPYVARAMMLARIKGIDLPLEPAPGGSTHSPEYLAMSPIGKMPVLEANGRFLPESEVICEFLEETGGGKPGLPADPNDRATSRLIARIVDLYVAPAPRKFFQQMNPATRDQEEVDKAAAELDKAFGFLEFFMGAGPFCVGAEPTLGDCAAIPYVVLIQKSVFAAFPELPDPTQGDGRLGTWWKAVQGHDICRESAEEYAEVVENFMKAMSSRLKG